MGWDLDHAVTEGRKNPIVVTWPNDRPSRERPERRQDELPLAQPETLGPQNRMAPVANSRHRMEVSAN